MDANYISSLFDSIDFDSLLDSANNDTKVRLVNTPCNTKKSQDVVLYSRSDSQNKRKWDSSPHFGDACKLKRQSRSSECGSSNDQSASVSPVILRGCSSGTKVGNCWSRSTSSHVRFEDTSRLQIVNYKSQQSSRALCGPAGNSHLSQDVLCLDGNRGTVRTFEDTFSWRRAMSLLDNCESLFDPSCIPQYDHAMSRSKNITSKMGINQLIKYKNASCFQSSLLVAFVVKVTNMGMSIVLVLKDPGGEILACLDEEASECYRNDIYSGCSLLLSRFIIYSPIGLKPYIILTQANIARIFLNRLSDILPQ